MSDSLITPEVRQYFRSRPWPSGLKAGLAEKYEPEQHLNIIFYRDNWLTLSRDDHYLITEIVKEIMAKFWGHGIPTYVGKIESIYTEDEDEQV